MLKHNLPLLLLASLGLIQLSQGLSTLVSNQFYSSCSGTGFPNFSYATAQEIVTGGTFTCSIVYARAVSFDITVTWFYYDTYPPPACGNADLPNGDQCCHSTATSTLSLYFQVAGTDDLEFAVISTGNVTAGAFLGESVTWTLFDPNAASLNFNCDKVFGQEAWTGLSSLTIGNALTGVKCLNGVQFVQACPGWRSTPLTLALG